MFRLLFFLLYSLVFIQTGYCFYENVSSEVRQTVRKVLTKWENKELELSLGCAQQLYQLFENLLSFDDGLWAYKMIDATGKFPSGLIGSNIVDMGSFDECLDIKSTMKNITGNYCSVTIDIGGFVSSNVDKTRQSQLLARYKELTVLIGEDVGSQISMGSLPLYGICIPNKCNALDVKNTIHLITEIIPLNIRCRTKDEIIPPLDTGAILTISLFAVIIALMVLSTLIDYIWKRKGIKLHPILISFSIYTNGQKLFGMRSGQGELTCLHGIRFLSMCWVILGHIHIVNLLGPTYNIFDSLDSIGKTRSMLYLNVSHAVDTFFVLSGLLVSYNFMKKRKNGEKFNIFTYYLHRYLRLTPAYAVVILCTLYILKYLATGPAYFTEDYLVENSCRDNWWRALLYIQNYIAESTKVCLSQSWNLDVDYQLYLISPILLFILYKAPMFGSILTLASVIGCMIANFVLTHQQHYSSIFGGRNTLAYMNEFYMKTHTRAPPWLIGAWLGYLLGKMKFYNHKSFLKIPRILVLLIWLIVLALVPVCIFGFHDALLNLDYDVMAHSLYNTFVRPVFALCVSWIIFACSTGYGGIVNDILSLPIFGVLSKFTYCMYLLHLTILYIMILSRKVPGYFSEMEMINQFFTLFATTFILSTFWILAFEMPILVIEPYLFGSRAAPKRIKQGENTITTNNENIFPTYRNSLHLKVRNGQPTSEGQTRF